MKDYILIKGRCGLEYYDENGIKYDIDSEMCISDEYNYAIYADSISLEGKLLLLLCVEEKEKIIDRVLLLCKKKKMKPKVFYDK